MSNHDPNYHSAKRLRSKNRRVRLLLTPCYYCGQPSDTFDHLVPLARGGPNTSINKVAACFRCNQTKRDMTELEFINYILALPTDDPAHGILRDALVRKAK